MSRLSNFSNCHFNSKLRKDLQRPFLSRMDCESKTNTKNKNHAQGRPRWKRFYLLRIVDTASSPFKYEVPYKKWQFHFVPKNIPPFQIFTNFIITYFSYRSQTVCSCYIIYFEFIILILFYIIRTTNPSNTFRIL